MSFSHRLEIRQAQSLVMTPQLLQAIRLLQMSSLELTAWVGEELERNPFLEAEAGDSVAQQLRDSRRAGVENTPPELGAGAESGETARPWESAELETSREALEASLDTDFSNSFDPDGPAITPASGLMDGVSPMGPAAMGQAGSGSGAGTGNTGSGAGSGDDFDPFLNIPEIISLREHLRRQLGLLRLDPQQRLIALTLVDAITDAGYLETDASQNFDGLAQQLGVARVTIDAALAIVQRLDPPGVCARDLSECLAIQLREVNRYDPAMAAMISRLDLVAKRDMAALRKLCGVDDDDLHDMLRELRALEPRPGRPFNAPPLTPLVADAIVRRGSDGDWIVELNNDALPRVLVNRAYYSKVSHAARSEAEKSFVTEAWQTANWLDRSLDQRARTILAVTTELVKQQEGFFAHGVAHLRPMTLKAVADAIGMHESTVSRVTANKSVGCERGVFEMKFFFSAAIASSGDGAAHAAGAIRHRVRQMIETEAPDAILSDDAIVRLLRNDGVDIARRTVAKYRESLRIPSSVNRRRLKAPIA